MATNKKSSLKIHKVKPLNVKWTNYSVKRTLFTDKVKKPQNLITKINYNAGN